MEDLEHTVEISAADDNVQLTTEVESDTSYCQFTISFTLDEWKQFLPDEEFEEKKTRRLEGGWTAAFYERILEATGLCQVTFCKNRLKKPNSRKHSSPYFHAGAKCKTHKNETFKIIIQEEPSEDQETVVAFVGVKTSDEPAPTEEELMQQQLLATFKSAQKKRSRNTPLTPSIQSVSPLKRRLNTVVSNSYNNSSDTEANNELVGSNMPKKLPKLSPNETFCVHIYNVLRTLAPRKQVHCRHRLNEVLSQFELDDAEL